jgi:hypothetical protein
MVKQWQQPWEPLQPQAALPVLKILLNGNGTHERMAPCHAEQNDPLQKLDYLSR